MSRKRSSLFSLCYDRGSKTLLFCLFAVSFRSTRFRSRRINYRWNPRRRTCDNVNYSFRKKERWGLRKVMPALSASNLIWSVALVRFERENWIWNFASPPNFASLSFNSHFILGDIFSAFLFSSSKYRYPCTFPHTFFLGSVIKKLNYYDYIWNIDQFWIPMKVKR